MSLRVLYLHEVMNEYDSEWQVGFGIYVQYTSQRCLLTSGPYRADIEDAPYRPNRIVLLLDTDPPY
jgi:hypothetical protein